MEFDRNSLIFGFLSWFLIWPFLPPVPRVAALSLVEDVAQSSVFIRLAQITTKGAFFSLWRRLNVLQRASEDVNTL